MAKPSRSDVEDALYSTDREVRSCGEVAGNFQADCTCCTSLRNLDLVRGNVVRRVSAEPFRPETSWTGFGRGIDRRFAEIVAQA